MIHLLSFSELFNLIFLFLLLNWINSLLCLLVLEYLMIYYTRQVVVLIGFGPSAFDIIRDVATVAKEVHVTTRAPNVTIGKLDNHRNIW